MGSLSPLSHWNPPEGCQRVKSGTEAACEISENGGDNLSPAAVQDLGMPNTVIGPMVAALPASSSGHLALPAPETPASSAAASPTPPQPEPTKKEAAAERPPVASELPSLLELQLQKRSDMTVPEKTAVKSVLDSLSMFKRMKVPVLDVAAAFKNCGETFGKRVPTSWWQKLGNETFGMLLGNNLFMWPLLFSVIDIFADHCHAFQFKDCQEMSQQGQHRHCNLQSSHQWSAGCPQRAYVRPRRCRRKGKP